jgi:hypothetical protein
MSKAKLTTRTPIRVTRCHQVASWYQELTEDEQHRVDAEMAFCRDSKARHKTREYWRGLVYRRSDCGKKNGWEKNLRQYGLTPADYDALLERQGGVCAICGATQGSQRAARLFVDHDHTTGRVRGVLCQSCNNKLHRMGDDLEGVLHFVHYLEHALKSVERTG